MHTIHLVQLAAALARHSDSILASPVSLQPGAMTRYWTTSRSRIDLWHRAIARFQDQLRVNDAVGMRRWWIEHRPVIEDVFLGGMLTRVLATLGTALDQTHDQAEWSPVTESILGTHLEASSRYQQLLLNSRGARVNDLQRLNQVRRRSERWSDVLVARIAWRDPSLCRFASDRERASLFAQEHRRDSDSTAIKTKDRLMSLSIENSIMMVCGETTLLPEANRAVASSVMGLLGHCLFDSYGDVASPDHLRLKKPDVGGIQWVPSAEGSKTIEPWDELDSVAMTEDNAKATEDNSSEKEITQFHGGHGFSWTRW
ncbi:MAG: hypothetical protein AAF664_12955 [Planctomycetota bacterium]